MRQTYAVPRDTIELCANDPRLFPLADRLWPRAPDPEPAPRPGIQVDLEVESGPPAAAGSLLESWSVGPEGAELRLSGQMTVAARIRAGTIRGRVRDGLLEQAPGLVARLLLEAPVAILLQHRGYAAVHAAAVAGPKGAIVLRGAPGAGKSTLAAAAYLAGLDVLGDESVLVARDDPDQLLGAVRDPTLEPETVRLLGLSRDLSPATERAGAKQRLELFSTASGGRRIRYRLASVVLGPRAGGPARLEWLAPEAFEREYPAGGIREEVWARPAPEIAKAWARRDAYRLSGTDDLHGAVRLLADLAGHVPQRGSRE